MKTVVSLTLGVIFLWLVVTHIRANSQLETDKKTIADMSAKLAVLDEQPSFEDQSRCAAAAKEFFNREGYGSEQDADFLNHYNPKLRKCFIVIKTSKWQPSTATMLTSKNVYDAVEGKTYGQYLWQSDKVKKWWEVAPIMCLATNPDGSDTKCKNDGEYTSIMANYMDIDDQ